MPISNKDKSMMKAWGKAGDIMSRAINSVLGGSKLIAGGTPAAKGTTNVHAAVASNAANLFPGPITNPDVPRNLRYVFAASYDGGNLTVVGTNQFGQTQTEVVTAVANTTVVGTKVFKTVTSITKATVGATANAVSVGTGDKIGLTTVPVSGSPVLLTANGVGEAVTFDATNNGFTPTTVPNGTTTYVINANV